MKFNKTVLKNGLRVVTVPMADNPTVTVLVLVEAGSKYETKDKNGLSHFLEHMCFKGTKKRPRAIDISTELDSIGAQYNAFTSNEWTGYFAKAEKSHSRLLLDIVSDIYLNSTFPEKEMAKERGVIIEEINMYNDLPQRKVQDLFMNLLYGDQPAGWDIAGTKETVSAITRDDMSAYHKKLYTAPKTLVVIAGDFHEKEMLNAVGEHFAGISKEGGGTKLKVVEEQTKPAILVAGKKTDQTHFVLGVRTFNIHDKRNSTLRVLAGVLGGGMSSRLFERMRNELGICYYVSAGADAFTDHGFFSVSAGVKNDRFPEAVREVVKELSDLTLKPVSQTELKKVKDFLIGSLYLGLETSDSVADFYGFQGIVKKNIKLPSDVAGEIQSVSAGDIMTLAKEIFTNENLNLAVIGPEEKMPKKEDLGDVLCFSGDKS